jgi:hypothetical protein
VARSGQQVSNEKSILILIGDIIMIHGMIQTVDSSLKSTSGIFIDMIDEMVDKYGEDSWIVFDSIGLSEKDYTEMNFKQDNFRKAINFYLKEKSTKIEAEL